MPRLLRRAAIAAATVATLLLAAASAGATGTGAVSVNTPNTTATSTNTVFTVNTAGGQRTVTCATFSLSKSITAGGAVTIANGSLATSGCRFAGVTVTLAQTAAWTGLIRHLDDGTGSVFAFTLDVSIPVGGLTLSAVSCRFTVNGSALGEARPATPIAHGALSNMTGVRFPALLVTNPLTLILNNVAGIGCAALGIANGNTARFDAVVAFTPAITLAGV